MGDKRFYQGTDDDFVPNEFGHELTITGMVFSGEDGVMYILLNDDIDDLDKFLKERTIGIQQINADQWTAVLQASDDPKYYGPDKAWHRKMQRLVSGDIQQKVWARDGFTCQFCGRKMGEVQMTIDHWIPLELGGENDTTNYISACRGCNKDKGAWHPKHYCTLKKLDFDKLDAIAHTKP